jgi:protein tyrosine/serine phosphatase
VPRIFKISLTILVLLILSSTGYFLYMYEQGNFHPITYGEAYRSAQLDRDEFEYYIKKYNIKSIVNLRGRHPDAPWYNKEIKVSIKHNIKHYDIALSSSSKPVEKDIRKLMEIFKNAPRPVLIHCLAGADRTGLASAMWEVIVDKKLKTEAEKQLSIFFGHLIVGKTAAMDRFFESWNPESY